MNPLWQSNKRRSDSKCDLSNVSFVNSYLVPVTICLPRVPSFPNAINSDSFLGVLRYIILKTPSRLDLRGGGEFCFFCSFPREWILRVRAAQWFVLLHILSSLWEGAIYCTCICICICICMYLYLYFCHLNLSSLWAGAMYWLQVHRWFVVGTFANRP